MSLLRRRHVGDGGGQAPAFKPFVLPVKKKAAAASHGGDDGDWEDESAAHNRQALRTGASLAVKRLPFLSFVQIEPERRAQKLCRPFKSPCADGMRTAESNRLLQVKTLGMRRRWSGMPVTPLIRHDLPPLKVDVEDEHVPEIVESDPVPAAPVKPVENAPPPLVLWQSEEDPDVKVVVPEIVGKFLRPHQREGVQFMFDCVCQVRGFDGQGCILADDMGLGKTLQSITLMYTLLMTGMTMEPTIKRAIVVCPTSLVKNWDDEIIKWLHGKVKTIALFEANRSAVIKGISQFIEGSKRPRPGFSAQVLIISYETFRMHAQRFIDESRCCDLLICDEAHRLKNTNSQINRALSSLACRKRVLLSGTPMQNDLEEFYAMVDFTNPNILGTPSEFRKNYLGPILVGREPDSTDRERNVAQSCSAMLCEIVNQFILRRGNILNAKHLPPKLMQVVCCPLSQLQEQLYSHFLESSAFRAMMKRENANVLSSITALKKLCNHPLLIFDEMGKSNTKLPGFEKCAHFFAAARSGGDANPGDSSLNRRGVSSERTCHPEWSGKMLLLDRLMMCMRKMSDDRIVIVSNYTQTLDVVSSLCRQRNLPFVRLDGTTSVKKRKKLVDTFNDPTTNSFAFLLSSKAGGCGLNLIGANRLVLFDPDWNPATDKQAAARVWREGQKKMCYVYRFLATGTLEEKIFQRQLSKEGLQNIVDDKEEVNSLSSKDLKRLFVFRKDTVSDTHDQLKCSRCQWRTDDATSNESAVITIDSDDDIEAMNDDGSGNVEKPDGGEDADGDAGCSHEKRYHPQVGMPPEEDLNSWGHHLSYDSVDDAVMQAALRHVQTDLVSFAFSCRVDWELLQEHQAQNEEKENQREEERKRRRLEKIEAANEKQSLETKAKKSTKKRRSRGDDSEESEDFTESSSSDSEIEEDGAGSSADEEEHETMADSDSEVEYAIPTRGSEEVEGLATQATPSTPRPVALHNVTSPHPVETAKAPSHTLSPPTSTSAASSGSASKHVTFDTSAELDLSDAGPPSKRPRISTYVDADDDDFDDDARQVGVSAPPSTAKEHAPVSAERDIMEEEHKESEWYDEESGWSCSRCTLENPLENDVCAGCGLRFRRSRLRALPVDSDVE